MEAIVKRKNYFGVEQEKLDKLKKQFKRLF